MSFIYILETNHLSDAKFTAAFLFHAFLVFLFLFSSVLVSCNPICLFFACVLISYPGCHC